MTWKEFKAAVEAEGVKDDDKIAYIDVGDVGVTDVKIWEMPEGGRSVWVE
jgi:hypothetical protein